MPQTLARVLVHVVFSTKDRTPSMKEQIRPSLFAYMAGILRSLAAFESMAVGSSEPVIVNRVSDHVHVLLTVPVALALADIMRVLKAKSSGWLRRTSPSFAWQAGYSGV